MENPYSKLNKKKIDFMFLSQIFLLPVLFGAVVFFVTYIKLRKKNVTKVQTH